MTPAEMRAQAGALEHSPNCKYPDGAADCPRCISELRAQADATPEVEPVGELVDLNDGLGTKFVEWSEARFMLTVGTKLYAHPDQRIAALEADLAAAQADHAYAIRMYDQKEAACIDALEKLTAAQAEVDRRVGIGAELIIARRERDALRAENENLRAGLVTLPAGIWDAAKLEADRADADRYRWLKECTNEQFDHLSGNWCALDSTIDAMMKIERNGEYSSTSAMKCQHVFDDDRCVICGGVA